MLTYELDERGNEPLYEYLYRRIRDDILAGTIGRDDPLPSKRALAKHLNISIMTVENAYAQLMTEGYIYSRPRSGFYAADVSDALRYRDETGGTGRERSAAEGGTGLRGPHDGTLFADFSSNQTQPDSFPFTTWARLTRRTLTNNKEQLMTNPPTGGVWELREAIASHLKAFRGIEIESDQVIVGAGTEYLYGLILQILRRTGLYRFCQKIITHRPISVSRYDRLILPYPWSTRNIRKRTAGHSFPCPASLRSDALVSQTALAAKAGQSSFSC